MAVVEYYVDPDNPANNVYGSPNPISVDTVGSSSNLLSGVGTGGGSSSDSSYQDGFTTISTLILNSQIYKNAHSLFSSGKYGSQFLSQLEMVPYSYDIRDENFWDSTSEFFGGTSGFSNAITDAFNQAMDEIRLLVQQYYQFIQELPETQVDQFADAGVNSAVTGQGIEGASMSDTPVATSTANTPMTEYNNQELSDGISRFVEFIGSVASIASTGINGVSLMGMLDLAEREGYSKQELHDLLMSKEGVTTSSPYRVLTPSNTGVVGDTARLKSAQVAADASVLDGKVSTFVGTDPHNTSHYEVRTGYDVMSDVARAKLVITSTNSLIGQIKAGYGLAIADTAGYLENEYISARLNAGISESGFNDAYYRARNGAAEGAAQTDIMKSIMSIRESERYLKELESWLTEFKSDYLSDWGSRISEQPSLAPYFYKALFDFDMADTFYHSSGVAMGLKYGMENLDVLGRFITNLVGVKKPPMRVGRTTRTTSTKTGS